VSKRSRKRPGLPPNAPGPGPRGSAADKAVRPVPRTWILLAGAALFACGCAVFWATRRYEFLNWDDPVYILKNPWIQSLTWQNVRAIFTQAYFLNYLPLHLLSYMLDHALWGLKPGGYHLSSVLIHGLNSVLCLVVVRRLSGSFAAGWIAALLFAVHPAHVEAVAWVSSRKEVLSTTFMLLSLWAYLHARQGRALRPLPYAASVVCFLLGMLSKASIVVLPAFLLLLDWVPRPARSPRPSLLAALASKVPYGIVGAILMLVNSRVQVTAKAAYVHDPVRYLAVKGHALWIYVGLLAGRPGQPDYDLPGVGGGALLFLNLAGLAALPALAWVFLRLKRRTEFLGMSWTFITLLPAAIFPLVTYMADRYLYAPSIGFCGTIAALAVGLGRLDRFPRVDARAVAAVAAVVAVAAGFTLETLHYSKVWQSSDSLWTFALTKSKDYRIYNNLADVRIRQQRWDEAEGLLKKGTEVENITSYQSLGVLYHETHRPDEALKATDQAIRLLAKEPKPIPSLSAELHFNRGAIFWMKNDVPAAISEWRFALREDPTHAQAREWLGIATSPPPAAPSPPASPRSATGR
jgi:hypothetical protein